MSLLREVLLCPTWRTDVAAQSLASDTALKVTVNVKITGACLGIHGTNRQAHVCASGELHRSQDQTTAVDNTRIDCKSAQQPTAAGSC